MSHRGKYDLCKEGSRGSRCGRTFQVELGAGDKGVMKGVSPFIGVRSKAAESCASGSIRGEERQTSTIFSHTTQHF
jgi:hypothetical protein